MRLERILRWCVVTDARWSRIEAACGRIPSTLVHADFVGENVRVRGAEDRLILLPFDWGTSGTGVPARDLVDIEIPVYLAAIRERWPAVTAIDIEIVGRIGRVFRRIAAVHRACLSLPYWPVEKVISDIRFLAVRA